MSERSTTFFVCGCPKSGTTWVQLLLDRHPEVSCAGESHLVVLLKKFSGLIGDHNFHQRRRNTAIFGDIVGYAPFPEIEPADERWLFESLVERMLEKAVHKPGVRAVGDKTPNLAEHLNWFPDMVPHAKFIHVIRDARDVAVSGWHHLHRTAPAAELRQLSAFRDYALLSAQLWQVVVLRARAEAARLGDRYLEVRYEDLHRDPDAAIERLLRFLGVAAEPALRRACIDQASFSALTGGRAAGQEDPAAFLRKGLPGDWRNWFDPALNTAVLAEIGPLLAALGYDEALVPAAG
jgi:Sulfotransferase family